MLCNTRTYNDQYNKNTNSLFDFFYTGYVTSGLSIVLSSSNPVGIAMTVSGGAANSISKHVVKVKKDRLHEALEKSLQREEVMYEQLIEHLAILMKHPELCFLHNRNETLEAFVMAFGRKNMESAKYWSLRNDPQKKRPILIHEMARQEEEDGSVQQMVEVALNTGGELVSNLLNEFTAHDVQDFVKLVLPPMKDVMKDLMASAAVRIAVANAGFTAVTEAAMNAGTAECVAQVWKQNLVDKATQILETFGCNVQTSSNGTLQHLTIDAGHKLSDKVVEMLNKAIEGKVFKFATGPDNTVR